MPLRYTNVDVDEFDALIDMPFNISSPFRSTVPHLAWWANYNERIAYLCDALDMPVAEEPSLTFEYTVAPTEGRGNPSHTDLMAISSRYAIGEEAKCTEQEYDNVAVWLGQPPSENKALVLNSWLGMINGATGSNLQADDVMEFTYQLIHRTASVCSIQATKRAVVYHGFNLSNKMTESYTQHLSALSTMMAHPKCIKFALATTSISPSGRYAELQRRWKANEGRDYSNEVRILLHERDVGTFGQTIVTVFE